ncbi:hypothetical protein RJT34_24187 [Clitoria ternatea]|uniref:Plant heme peroxidase family profile domain-containing protein n=1 Tax=Clitoria ternatea TaxID=43366 RepID=A0AAN9FQ84_CLITE
MHGYLLWLFILGLGLDLISLTAPIKLTHGANNGLDIPVRLLEPIKEQFPTLSYAEFYQLAGVVALEVTGGPGIFHPGKEAIDL